MPQPVTLTAAAPAKINLVLDVLGRREDGYHELKMVMASVSLYDELTLTLTPCEAGREVFSASDSNNALPADEKNLAVRAARLFMEETGHTGRSVRIHILKRIPVCAGLGGGSGDAAAVLRALSEWHPIPEERLAELALSLGSDVPYCLRGGLCLAEGRGERLTLLAPLPECFIVLATPSVAVSTAAAFQKLGEPRRHPDWARISEALQTQNLAQTARLLFNAFSLPHGDCAAIRDDMVRCGAAGAVMSGSGPSVYGIFDNETLANKAFEKVSANFPNTFITKPV